MTTAEVKKLVGNKNLILGTERTVSYLKKGKLKKIFLAANCSKEVKEDIENAAKLFGVEVSKLDINNDELGVVVKKPFSVTVISLLK